MTAEAIIAIVGSKNGNGVGNVNCFGAGSPVHQRLAALLLCPYVGT